MPLPGFGCGVCLLSACGRVTRPGVPRVREHGILEHVTAAICRLARKLEEDGSPADYAIASTTPARPPPQCRSTSPASA